VHDRHANTGAGELSFTCLGNAAGLEAGRVLLKILSSIA
jgi:hypothetical protein